MAGGQGVHSGRAGALSLRLRALRAFSFPLSGLPVLVAWAAVGGDVAVVLACVAGAVLLHAWGNLLNDYFDYRYGVDRWTICDEGRPGRLLVRGKLEPSSYLRMACAAALAALLPALFIWRRAGAEPLAFALLGATLAYVYTGPPLRLKHRAMGEPTVFLAFGPLLMGGTAVALTGRWPADVAWLSVPVGAAVAGVLVGDNLRDLEEDREGGICTLVMFLSPRMGRWLYAGLVVGSALGAAALGLAGVLPWPAVFCPLALAAAARPLRHVLSGRRLANVDALTARYAALLMVALIAVLLWCE